MTRAVPFFALLRHEATLLWHNRMASVVLVLLVVVAVLIRATDADRRPEPVCYVLYWQRDAWVVYLERSAARANAQEGLAIEIAPVERFVRHDGVLYYPAGSHSIQLRPPEPGPDGKVRRLVWFWYSGDDPHVLFPYARWFWSATRDFFPGTAQWDEAVTPLHQDPLFAAGDHRFDMQRLLDRGTVPVWRVALVLFFCAGHLPALCLAQQKEAGTLASLVLTTIGWRELAWAKGLFYGLLAIAMATVIALILSPAELASGRFWIALGAGTGAYLGLALLIGSVSRSVVSASAALVAYLLLAGLAFGVSRAAPAPLANALGLLWVEGTLYRLLQEPVQGAEVLHVASADFAALFTAGLWQLAGWLGYRRLRGE